MAINPQIQQGTLNRVRCSVVVPSNSALNIASSYMGQSFASLEFEGSFSDQIMTATGVVNSPEPYVMASISVGLLRTQALSSAWLAQAQTQSDVGDITIHSDSAAYGYITISNCVISTYNPGAFDGKDPVVRLSLRGVLYSNNALWDMI